MKGIRRVDLEDVQLSKQACIPPNGGQGFNATTMFEQPRALDKDSASLDFGLGYLGESWIDIVL
jgi:hypothetical protein